MEEMGSKKNRDSILDVITTVGLPVISGAFFIVWVIHFLKTPFITFPLILILVYILYFFSGSVYSGVLTVFAVATGIIGVIIIEDTSQIYYVLAECVIIVCFYFVFDMYREKYLAMKNAKYEEYETLEREIAIKDSEILENKKRNASMQQQIKNFQQIGRMIQTFQVSLDEKEILVKSGDIAAQFIGSGNWRLKKNVHGDIFAKYIKNTGLPLIVTDISKDRRFDFVKNRYLSVIAVPIEVNGGFWGIIKGTSYKANNFNDSDLRLLSILSGIVSTVLNNAYLYKKASDLAITDGLTGLFTQSYFKERLREEINRSKSNKVSLSVGILDIDFFKKINDTYGHQAGDVILRQIALLLRGRFRETDLIARYGGEEFGVIMLHTDSKEAFKVLEEMRTTIEAERFFIPTESYSPVQVRVTVSIGFTEFKQYNSSVETELIKRADSALYEAKSSGRNRTVEFAND
ncbi:MAG: sensor domain-containing diguanylate cyclase [Endomicrobia bacterium]|nr:sensor domain-containing diguanylate cyclase [Endomicrobiia bacterium]MCL2799593.1 sensor domain-containing diguanylate cyclase [Endomicrobiia bacterium]